MYNKNQFKKINDKKILHKIGKHWVTISVALLSVITGGTVATHTTANANSINNNANHTTINSRLQDAVKNSTQNSTAYQHNSSASNSIISNSTSNTNVKSSKVNNIKNFTTLSLSNTFNIENKPNSSSVISIAPKVVRNNKNNVATRSNVNTSKPVDVVGKLALSNTNNIIGTNNPENQNNSNKTSNNNTSVNQAISSSNQNTTSVSGVNSKVNTSNVNTKNIRNTSNSSVTSNMNAVDVTNNETQSSSAITLGQTVNLNNTKAVGGTNNAQSLFSIGNLLDIIDNKVNSGTNSTQAKKAYSNLINTFNTNNLSKMNTGMQVDGLSDSNQASWIDIFNSVRNNLNIINNNGTKNNSLNNLVSKIKSLYTNEFTSQNQLNKSAIITKILSYIPNNSSLKNDYNDILTDAQNLQSGKVSQRANILNDISSKVNDFKNNISSNKNNLGLKDNETTILNDDALPKLQNMSSDAHTASNNEKVTLHNQHMRNKSIREQHIQNRIISNLRNDELNHNYRQLRIDLKNSRGNTDSNVIVARNYARGVLVRHRNINNIKRKSKADNINHGIIKALTNDENNKNYEQLRLDLRNARNHNNSALTSAINKARNIIHQRTSLINNNRNQQHQDGIRHSKLEADKAQHNKDVSRHNQIQTDKAKQKHDAKIAKHNRAVARKNVNDKARKNHTTPADIAHKNHTNKINLRNKHITDSLRHDEKTYNYAQLRIDAKNAKGKRLRNARKLANQFLKDHYQTTTDLAKKVANNQHNRDVARHKTIENDETKHNAHMIARRNAYAKSGADKADKSIANSYSNSVSASVSSTNQSKANSAARSADTSIANSYKNSVSNSVTSTNNSIASMYKHFESLAIKTANHDNAESVASSADKSIESSIASSYAKSADNSLDNSIAQSAAKSANQSLDNSIAQSYARSADASIADKSIESSDSTSVSVSVSAKDKSIANSAAKSADNSIANSYRNSVSNSVSNSNNYVASMYKHFESLAIATANHDNAESAASSADSSIANSYKNSVSASVSLLDSSIASSYAKSADNSIANSYANKYKRHSSNNTPTPNVPVNPFGSIINPKSPIIPINMNNNNNNQNKSSNQNNTQNKPVNFIVPTPHNNNKIHIINRNAVAPNAENGNSIEHRMKKQIKHNRHTYSLKTLPINKVMVLKKGAIRVKRTSVINHNVHLHTKAPIDAYTSPIFARRNHTKNIKAGKNVRINKIFKVNNNGLKYECALVSYHNHHYYAHLSSRNAINDYYYPTVHHSHYVKILRGLRAYKNKNFSSSKKVKHFRAGNKLRIRKIVRLGHYGITRIQLTNGTYITGLRNYVELI